MTFVLNQNRLVLLEPNSSKAIIIPNHRPLLLKLDQCHHILAISCNERGIGFGRGWDAVHMRNSTEVDCAAVCIVLKIDGYALILYKAF